jgi:hypothetical protein
VRFTPQEFDHLLKLAAEQNATVSEVLRQAVGV